MGHSRFQELDDPGVFRRRISSAERTSDFWTLVGFATLSGLPSHSRCRVCRLRSACHERSRSGLGGVGFERKGTFSAVRSGFSSDLRGGRCKPSHRRCHSKPPPTRQCPVLGRRLSRSSPSNHPVSRNSCPRLLRGNLLRRLRLAKEAAESMLPLLQLQLRSRRSRLENLEQKSRTRPCRQRSSETA